MTVDLSARDWLADLVEAELDRFNPEVGPAWLPAGLVAAAADKDLAPGARVLVARSLRHRPPEGDDDSPEAAFGEELRGHLGLVLELHRLAGTPWLRHRGRVELAASLAGALDEHALALAVEASSHRASSTEEIAAALRAAGKQLRSRFFPPGDPIDGLPLHPGARASFRRHLARVAMGLHRTGRLEAEALARHRAFAERERTLLCEALSSLLTAAAPPPGEQLEVLRRRQLGRLGLTGARLRDARHAVAAPRTAGALALATPARMRPFLLEQLLLAVRRANLSAVPATAFIEAFREAAGLDAQALGAAQVEAAAQHDDHLAWFKAVGGPGTEWQQFAEAWTEASDEVVERVSEAVITNYDAFTTELRETGELGQLLAKAAGGVALTAEEKRKVKAQLIDLAKAVPALAIFAAPGGLLLLPLLAKLLPFSLLPGAWEQAKQRERARLLERR